MTVSHALAIPMFIPPPLNDSNPLIMPVYKKIK